VEPLEDDAACAVLADDPHQVYHGPAPLHGFGDSFWHERVARNPINRLEPLEVRLGAGAHQAPDEDSVGLERVDHGFADKPGSAGDEDPHHSGIVSLHPNPGNARPFPSRDSRPASIIGA
jgi:hypothetical protein